MDKDYVKNYWKDIRHQAWISAQDNAGMKILIPSLIVLLTASGLGGLFLMFGVMEYPFFKDNLVANSLTGLSQVVISVAILIYMYFHLLYEIPPKVYQKQEVKIKFLEDKWEGEVVGIILPIREFNDPSYLETSGNRKVGIFIKNPSNKNLSQVNVKLVGLTWIVDKQNIDKLEFISESNRNFIYKKNFIKPDIIGGGREGLVYITEINEDGLLTFLLEKRLVNENWYTSSPQDEKEVKSICEQQPLYTGFEMQIAVFEINLEINGVIDGKIIQTQLFDGHLQFIKRKMEWVHDGSKWIKSENIGWKSEILLRKIYKKSPWENISISKIRQS